MNAPDETFDGTWPYAPHFFSGNGFQHHYVDEGPVTILPGVGHFIQEDAPEIATALISQFVQMT